MHDDHAITARATPASSGRRADQICDRFEAAWKKGQSPEIEQYLGDVAESEQPALLRELLMLELSCLVARGQQPSQQTYLNRFPAHRTVVEDAFRDAAEQSAAGGTWPEIPADVTPDRERPDLELAFPEAWRYEILAEVGSGAMGVVYRARDKKLDRQVAIKVLRPGYPTNRFLREARLLARVSSPYVVSIHDFHLLTGGYPILSMEWVDGLDLLKTMHGFAGPLPEERVLLWMKQASEGMLVAAEQGIIHRDLKPSNILIDSTGRARVADFGLARGPVASDLSASTQVMGTPLYMAPEQAEDPRSADTRSDIYSFGATFYHVLTGQPPFTGPTIFSVLFKHKTEPLVPPTLRNHRISRRTSELLERCLAKSPAERFQSFSQVLSELQARPETVSPWDTSEDTELLPYVIVFRSRRDAYLNEREPFCGQDRYDFPDNRQLLIVGGNILDQNVDALVSSSDGCLSMDFGVSLAIRATAGDVVVEEARRYAPARPGRAVVTSGGRLSARFIFHGITLGYWNNAAIAPSRDLISEILASCFYHADSVNVHSIAFPLLGTGAGGFPRDVCLDTTFRSLARILLQGVTLVQDVRIVLFSERAT
jgi:serine/threonine protein kinase